MSDTRGLAVDANGNVLVADSMSHSIRRISPDGTVTTVAGGLASGIYIYEGYNDADARTARFNSPKGIAVDSVGNIYVADCANHAIRTIKIDGQVGTLAGGRRSYLAAQRKRPPESAFLPPGYDFQDLHQPGGFADGRGDSAEFNCPEALSLDAAGNLYVVDRFNLAIRKVSPDGVVTTPLGTPRGLDTQLGPLPKNIGPARGVALLPDGQLAIAVLNAVVRTNGAKL